MTLTRAHLLALALPLTLSLVACGDKETEDDDDTGDIGEDVDADGDGYPEDSDCDDTNADVHPDAAEVCDGIDNDCDELVDGDDDSVDLSTGGTFFTDADGDGFGVDGETVQACDAPEGTAAEAGDCDDADAGVNPGATEVCDEADIDEDCSGAADDADAGVDTGSQTATWPDADGDGFGDADAAPTGYCDPPSGVVADDGDCDDTDAAINPGATEVCDDADVDEDCSGLADDLDPGVDASTQTLAFPDGDGDGYGDDADAGTRYCDPPSGTVADGTDCDDGESGINPGATEVCDDADVDEDCDGLSDDADSSVTGTSTWYTDSDSDGYGDAASVVQACSQPSGTVTDSTDCDDTDIEVNPGATEECDGVDNDCDGTLDDATCLSCDSLSVLTYYDSFSTGNDEPANDAATALGASAVAHSNSSDFATDYDATTWDVIVIDVPGSGIPAAVQTRMATQISTGGIVLFSYWNLDSDTAMQSTLGVSVDSSFNTPLPVYGTSTSTLWSIEETLPDPISNYTADAGDNGDVISAVDPTTSEQLAHFSADTSQGAIVATNNGQIVVNGFLPWDFNTTDDDSDGTNDMIELFTNEIIWATGCAP